MNVLNLFIVSIISLFSTFLNEPSFEYLYPPSTLKGKFWVENDEIKILLKDGIFTYNIKSKNKSFIELNYNHDIYEKLYVEKLNNDLLFFDNEGGVVYEKNGDKLLRIDNSYNHRLHHQSLNFNHKNVHYRFGGYGFFERSRSLVFFNQKNNEWELKFNFEKFLNQGLNEITFHEIRDDHLFLYGGNISINSGHEHRYSNNVLKLNLENNELKVLGRINKEFPETFKNYISNGNQILLLRNTKLLYIFNIENNIFYKKEIDFKPQLLIGIVNNHLFYFTQPTYEKNIIHIESIPLRDLYIDEHNEGLYLYDNSYFKLCVLGFLSIIIFILIFGFNKVKNKIIIGKDRIIDPNGQEIILDDQQIHFLNFLQESERTNVDVISFLSNEHLDMGHQNRLKNKLIKSINDVFLSRTGEKIILVTKSVNDKRTTCYRINNHY